ncbi:hypothetical protein [Brevibacillus dissolubilis]|uniref:hypothetical protein n=1 Tax=Brevibacillus dissolubilis TaxID=1844116 RepID=UPI0011175D2E|nr:hypothetical protein [Brevibacillus dissolubilis]
MPSTIIAKYQKILDGEQKRFSPYEFEDVQYRKQKVQMILRYAIEQVMHWTPEQARDLMTYEDAKDLKLFLLNEYIEPPIEAKMTDVYYMVDYAYPYLPRPSEKEKVLWVYREVLEGKRRHFPQNYFQSLKGEERARICFDHLCHDILKIRDKRNIPAIFSKTDQAHQILRKYKLKILIDSLYFSPFDMVTNIHHELTHPALWQREIKIHIS